MFYICNKAKIKITSISPHVFKCLQPQEGRAPCLKEAVSGKDVIPIFMSFTGFMGNTRHPRQCSTIREGIDALEIVLLYLGR